MYDEKCLLRIGSNIKLLRSVRQLNQHQLAERLGISQTHLSNIEHNNVLVSLKLLVRSANVLGCSLEALLDRAAAVEWAGAHCTDGGEEAENKGKSAGGGKGNRKRAFKAICETPKRGRLCLF